MASLFLKNATRITALKFKLPATCSMMRLSTQVAETSKSAETDLAKPKEYMHGIELYAGSDEIIEHPPPIPKMEIELSEEPVKLSDEQPLEDLYAVWFGRDMPTIHDEARPERDTVNFPRLPKPLHEPETRFKLIPYSWFQFFYPKTGVTGPYLFGVGLANFLVSKEFYVIDHEAYTGFCLITLGAFLCTKFGPQINRFLESSLVTEEKYWVDWQKGMLTSLGDYIDIQKKGIAGANNVYLFDAKRENIHLQREAEYRRRLMNVYSEVKRKLDFQIAVQESQTQFNQRHMVSWVIENVNKAITPELQKQTLNKAIDDLKLMSSKKAGLI